MADFIDSWSQTEEVIFTHLVEAISLQSGKLTNDLPPGVLNCWVFSTGGGSARHTWGGNGCFTSLRTTGQLQARTQSRAAGRKVAGEIIHMLKVKKNMHLIKNIQWFRIGEAGMPDIEETTFQPANNRDGLKKCHILRMSFDVVYNTVTEEAGT